MGKIQILNQNLANLIAAGEVVERPLNVVKELVENSIDAQATDIKVILKNSGLDELTVIDNGIGMDRSDATLCFSAHATSKLKDETMLFNIATLGFRGEALNSISSVSHVELSTYNGTESSKVVVANGEIIETQDAAARKGTSITVTKLFHNTPARLKYITNPYLELTKIVDFITKIALAYPEISFELKNDSNQIILTTGSGDIKRTISSLYSLELSKEVQTLNETGEFNITLHLAKPEFQRSSKNYITVFINNRVVNNSSIVKTVLNSYSPYMPKSRYPFCIVKISTDPQLIDVNIHPNKLEVKLSKQNEIQLTIQKLISEFLKNKEHIVNYKAPIQKSVEFEELNLDRDYLKKQPETFKYNQQVENTVIKDSDNIETHPTSKTSRIFNPIGQFAGTYIIAQDNDELILIDQHAANERVNYEKNKNLMTSQDIQTRELLVPITLTYNQSEAMQVKNVLNKLNELKIEISEFGINDFVVRSVPNWLQHNYEKECIELIIERALNNSSIEIVDILDEEIEMISCKQSIKANTKLSILEMESLIDELLNCENPYNCPHGRPVIVRFSKYEIEKLFKRVL